MITGGAEKTIGHGHLFPSINALIVSCLENILYWIVFVYGVKNVISLFSKKCWQINIIVLLFHP